MQSRLVPLLVTMATDSSVSVWKIAEKQLVSRWKGQDRCSDVSCWFGRWEAACEWGREWRITLESGSSSDAGD